jgi:hypothetical protein
MIDKSKNILNWELFLEDVVGRSPISNTETYISDMNKSMPDKLFFLNKIKPDVIVDFGCADGTVLLNIIKRYPNIKLIGYDLDSNMVEKARNKVSGVKITDNWKDVENSIHNYKTPALLLSSVIHEVYSYSEAKNVKRFWENQVFSGLFKYVVIRDMIPSVQLQKEDFLKFRENVKKVNKLADKKQLFSFEKIWGLIDNDYRTFMHWLLKYTYKDNWDREVAENYLPISLETLYKKIPHNYKIIYKHNFIFEPIQKKVMRDFGIKLTHNTHTKMIIERKHR